MGQDHKPLFAVGPGVRRARRAVCLALATSAALAASAPQAFAGSYPITATGGAFCSLAQFNSNVAGFSTFCGDPTGASIVAPAAGTTDAARQLFEIDSPNLALTITAADALGGDANLTGDYGGGTYWSGGGASWTPGVNGDDEDSGTIASQYWGIQVECGGGDGCGATPKGEFPASVEATGVDLTVTENTGPSLSASGLWDEAGTWIWNPPGDPWPLSLSGNDASGACQMSFALGTATLSSPSQARNTAVWQQCPNWTWSPSVDTTSYVPASGQIPFTVEAQNAAAVPTSDSETLDIDNVAPTVSLLPLNDANPGGWSVSHPVTLQVAISSGPSGFSSGSCSDTVGSTTTPLTTTPDPAVPADSDVTIDGNGTHTISCNVANNAVDPQGAHNTASTSQTVDIDEQPPSLTFAPTDPANPDQVVVQTSDNESAVRGGSIQIVPQGGGSPTALPTTFTSNGQLVATVPDATLKAGAYTVEATATSAVGNSGTTSENVTLPLRTGARSKVSFGKLVGFMTKRVRERVLVGFHYGAKLNKQGKPVRVKVGGHLKTIFVIKRVDKCTTKRVKVAKHRWKLKTTCTKPHIQYQEKLTVGHGKPATVYGELLSSQGVPIVNQSVTILTAASNGKGAYRAVGTVTSNASGGWKTKLPAGPSRIVKASFGGAPTIRPASGIAHLYVPARIIIRASATKVRWSGVVTIRGQLTGGYVPRDGVAMRLLIRLPGRKAAYSPVPFRTTSRGAFAVRWTWGTGSGVATYPFSVATTASESDYPYSASASRRIDVTFSR